MKLNKLLIISLVILLTMAGCGENGNKIAGNNTQEPDSEKEPYGKYSINGKIVKMDQDGFHVQSGENVDVYNIDTGPSSSFYIGDYVRLESKGGDLYNINLDKEYDYTGIKEDLFDQASKINVRVAEIAKDETGAMRIYGLAADKKEYDIVTNADTAANFAYSSLKVDDEIVVYPEYVTGDIPAAVRAKAVFKTAAD